MPYIGLEVDIKDDVKSTTYDIRINTLPPTENIKEKLGELQQSYSTQYEKVIINRVSDGIFAIKGAVTVQSNFEVVAFAISTTLESDHIKIAISDFLRKESNNTSASTFNFPEEL